MGSRHAAVWAMVFGVSGVGVLVGSAWAPGGVPAPSSEVVWTATGRGIAPLGELEGRVTEVDARRGTIALRVGPRTAAFRVNAQTTVFVAGRTTVLDELRKGDVVRATFAPGGSVPVAQWLERIERDGHARRPPALQR